MFMNWYVSISRSNNIRDPRSENCTVKSFFTVLDSNEMRKLNSAVNPGLGKDNSQKQLPTQYSCSRENIQVLLEVEVIESLYAAMSREKKNTIDQGGVVEVTIIPPGTADPFIHSLQNIETLRTLEKPSKTCNELQHRARYHGRSATTASDRRRLPHLDKRQNKGFIAENLNEHPETVGDLPSKKTLKPRIFVPENKVNLRHGDHYDPLQQTVTAELLKSYINCCNSESKMRDTPHCANPLVYQVHLDVESTERNYPYVELSAAEKILEAYAPDISSRCKAERRIIEAMRKTLTEWGSDEKRISDTLYNDTSALMRCEHCGVISFKKEVNLVPKTGDEFSAKLHSADDDKCLSIANTNSTVRTHHSMSRNNSNKNTSRSRSSTFIVGKETTEGMIDVQNVGIEKGSSAADFMTAERESDSISAKTIEVIDDGQKKDLQTTLPSLTMNKCGRCSAVEKSEKSNDTGFKNTYSSRYSPRLIVAKAIKKPAFQNTCRDNRIGNNFENCNSGKKIQGKDSTPLSKNCRQMKAESNISGKCETLSVKNASLNKKSARGQVASANIAIKLERTSPIKPSSTKNVANYLAKKKPSAGEEKERTCSKMEKEPFDQRRDKQCLITSKCNENKSQSKADIWLWKNQTLLGECIPEGSQDERPPYNSPTKSLLRHYPASLDDKSSTDQEWRGKDQLSNCDNEQRTFRSSKNRKVVHITSGFNCSAPLIGLPKEPLGNPDFREYTEESETTAFSSSSSDNVIREWANSLARVPKIYCKQLIMKNNAQSSLDKCSRYDAAVSAENLYGHKTFVETDNPSILYQKNVAPGFDNIAKQYELFKNTEHRNFSVNSGKMIEERFRTTNNSETLLPTDDTSIVNSGSGETTFYYSQKGSGLKFSMDKYRDNDEDDLYTEEGIRSEKNLVKNVSEKIRSEQSEIQTSKETIHTTTEIYLNEEKYTVLRTPVRKAFDESSNNALKMTYKNSASVISSSSDHNTEDHRELDIQRRSLRNYNESETFERQITYDGISSKDISAESRDNLEPKSLPVYRKILESKDEMDWETFEQLVGTLHPSQRELWSDICKAVSNEARRVAGQTGASTEVCIEINPVPTSQVIPYKKISRVKTSGDEVSFEMDMILTDSETFLDQKLNGASPKTSHHPEKCLQ